ncbi:type I-E CRISPR-associated protein Cse1/CasA [Pseudomonas aeruginosa]|nr:type I-E CRISPR-associated protein Cse1/CasA [Pseudomonas aeruginosa]
MGLLEVFREAERISALAETEPPSLIAQYRLLLAITHRALCWSTARGRIVAGCVGSARVAH